MAKKLSHIGIKYGYLTGLKYLYTDTRDGAAVWTWRCDCGNEKDIKAKIVTAGRTRTCGTCQLKHKLKATSLGSTLAKNRRLVREFQKYIRISQRRGLKWALSIEEFNRLATSECTLCRNPPPSKGWNKVEPQSKKDGFTVGGCYSRCQGCEDAFHKIELSLLIDRIVAVFQNISK